MKASVAAQRSARSAALFEPEPLPFVAGLRAYPWIVVGTVCVGAFMGQLDASIAQLLLPTLQRALSVSVGEVSWVALVYLVVLAATLPVFGRLADLVGRKLLYTAGFAIFTAGSVACGFASSLELLLAARVVQAVGAGLLQANSVAIIAIVAGPARRGRAIGLQGAAQAIGLSLGPTLGGLLIQMLGWQWVFWINGPVGVVGIALGLLVLPRSAPEPGEHARLDWQSAAFLMPAIALVLVALSEMPTWGITSLPFAAALAGSASLFAAFVWRERHAPSPLIDLDLFRSRAFSSGNAAGLIAYALLFGLFFLLPYALERGYGEAPLEAGLRLTAIPLALGLAAPFSGALSDRLGARALTGGGMLLSAGGLGVLAIVLDGSGRSLWAVTGALAAFGAGQGLFTAPNNSAIIGAAPQRRLGAAAGVLNVMRTLGTSIGVAAAATLLVWRVTTLAGPQLDALDAPASDVLLAIRYVLILFASLAVVSAAISWARDGASSESAEAR